MSGFPPISCSESSCEENPTLTNNHSSLPSKHHLHLVHTSCNGSSNSGDNMQIEDVTSSSSRSSSDDDHRIVSDIRLGSAKDVFNFPISELPVILDVRDGVEYVDSHIQGAISCPNVRNLVNKQVIEARIKSFIDNYAPENTRTIFIYGNIPMISTNRQEILQSFVQTYPLVKYLQVYGLPRRTYEVDDITMDGTEYSPIDTIICIPHYSILQNTLPFLIVRNCDQMFDESDQFFQTFYPSMIVDDALYLGTYQHSLDDRVLDHLKIDIICNITIECKPITTHGSTFTTKSGKEIEYIRYQAYDLVRQDMTKIWITMAKNLHSWLTTGKRVLIHCHAGKSRSASCIIFYFMLYHKYSFLEAWQEVRRCRPVVSPNVGFLKQLEDWDRYLKQHSGIQKKEALLEKWKEIAKSNEEESDDGKDCEESVWK